MLDLAKYIIAESETAIPFSVFKVSRNVMGKLHRRKGTIGLLMKISFSKNDYMLICHHLKQGFDLMSVVGIYCDLRKIISPVSTDLCVRKKLSCIIFK